MENSEILTSFEEKIKQECFYKKILNQDIIEQIIDVFTFKSYEKLEYPKEIDNLLELALEFYKDYNFKYYTMIINGIKNRKIIINNEVEKPYLDIKTNVAYLNCGKNDGDLFMIVHELAHFVDRNSNPKIIPDKFWFLSEVFSLYMEKRLQSWLMNKGYQRLIFIRENNRMYHESNMLMVIKNELRYEDLYKRNGSIKIEEICIDEVKEIMKYRYPNLVNYLLSYPIGNILSDYLINISLFKDDDRICEECLKVNWYEILPMFKRSIKR